MKKPLSREKLLERLDGLYKNRSAYCNSEVFSLEKAAYFMLSLEVKKGLFDEGSPAFDVDGLINSFSQRILYLQGLNKARKSSDPKYFEAETIIKELNNQIVFIKQKLKKESEMSRAWYCCGCKKEIMGSALFRDGPHKLFCSKECLDGKEPEVEEGKLCATGNFEDLPQLCKCGNSAQIQNFNHRDIEKQWRVHCAINHEGCHASTTNFKTEAEAIAARNAMAEGK